MGDGGLETWLTTVPATRTAPVERTDAPADPGLRADALLGGERSAQVTLHLRAANVRKASVEATRQGQLNAVRIVTTLTHATAADQNRAEAALTTELGRAREGCDMLAIEHRPHQTTRTMLVRQRDDAHTLARAATRQAERWVRGEDAGALPQYLPGTR